MSQPLPPDFAPFQESPAPAPPRKRTGLITVLLTLVVLLAVAILLNASVLRISSVAVVGNSLVSAEEVVSAAGLKGKTYFSLNEAEIAQGINAHRYLIYAGTEKRFPDTVILYVSERIPAANVQVMGTYYLIDAEGMVLERQGEKKSLPDYALPVVTGIQVKDIRVGHLMTAGSVDQMDTYLQVMKELTLQGFAGQVSELNLSDLDRLYLVTRDGCIVYLGAPSDLRAKIGTVRAVTAKLEEMGLSGGSLEASIPGEATYTPSSR